MCVACVEPVGDALAGLSERDVLGPDRPFAGKGPVVGAQSLGQLLGVGFVEHRTPR